MSTEEHKTSLPLAQKNFHSLQQKSKESASAYIARVDLAVSNLTKLGEPVSDNTWIYALTNGLRTEFEETRKGVLFARTGFDTVLAIKESIINEEIVLGNGKDKVKESTKEKDSTAFAATDHSHLSCHYCGIKGHIQPDCRKKKRDEQKGDFQKGTKLYKPKGKGGKNKGQ